MEKKACGDMLQYFKDNPDKLKEKLARDKAKKITKTAIIEKTAQLANFRTNLDEMMSKHAALSENTERKLIGGTGLAFGTMAGIEAGERIMSKSKVSGRIGKYLYLPTAIASTALGASQLFSKPKKPIVKTAQPTEAQAEAGNYKKKHIRYNGMEISIENPAGSVRKGTDAKGNEWRSDMYHHYGYIKKTVGVDKDHIDVFIKPGTKETKTVFVVNQAKKDGTGFDEHKCMLGFDNEKEAKEAYLKNYEKNWKGLGSIVEMTIDQFKKWVYNGKKSNPAKELVMSKQALLQEIYESVFNDELEKIASEGFERKKISLGRSFVAGLDPTGTGTFRVAQKAKRHKLHKTVGVAGGIAGGLALIPSGISGIIGGIKGVKKTPGGFKKKIIGAAIGAGKGAIEPYTNVYHGLKASKGLAKSKVTGVVEEKTLGHINKVMGIGKDPKDINSNKFINMIPNLRGKEDINNIYNVIKDTTVLRGKEGINDIYNVIKDKTVAGIKDIKSNKFINMIPNLRGKEGINDIYNVIKDKTVLRGKEGINDIYNVIKDKTVFGISGLAASGAIGGGSSFLQYNQGRKVGDNTIDLKRKLKVNSRFKK